MVHCKNAHEFSGIAFNKKGEVVVIAQGETITASSMVSQASQVIVVTNQRALLMQLPALAVLGEFPLQSKITCVKAFDSAPGMFFFGQQI